MKRVRRTKLPSVPPVIQDAKEKPPFDYECVTEIPGVDPLVATYTEFDFESVCAAFGEAEDTGTTNLTVIAQMAGEILSWLVRDGSPEKTGRRAIALQKALSGEEP